MIVFGKNRTISCLICGIIMLIAAFSGMVNAESPEDEIRMEVKIDIDSHHALKNENMMSLSGLKNSVPNGMGDLDPLAPLARGRGGWSIAEKWNNKTLLNNTIFDIATGDLNGDGYADLAVVGENHTIATYHNNHSFGFRKHFVDIDNNKNYSR